MSRCTRRSITTSARCSGCCARRSPRATCSRSAGAMRRSWRPAPSCWSAARGSGLRPSRSPDRSRRSADPSDRRPSRRAAAAEREGPRGERDRRAADRARAPPALGVGDRGARAGPRARRQHPAPRHADPGAAGGAARARSSWPGVLHPTPAVGGEPLERGRDADPGARGAGSRLVRRDRSGGPTPPATASSASRCAARCCAASSPACTPAAGSCATPTRRPSWPRPRSSWAPCCRCWRAGRGPTRGAGPTRLGGGRTADLRSPPSASDRPSRDRAGGRVQAAESAMLGCNPKNPSRRPRLAELGGKFRSGGGSSPREGVRTAARGRRRPPGGAGPGSRPARCAPR